MFWKEAVLDKPITRIDSPKVVRERRSKDVVFASNSNNSTRSPRYLRRNNGDANLQKLIFDISNCCWTLKYEVENKDYARGSYGKIILAKDKFTKEKVVIKQIPQTTPIRMITNEVKAGKILGNACENIASLYQYNDKPDFHYLVFQYVKGQDLFSYLEKTNFAPRTEIEARATIIQIFRALKFIHSHNIAHRDIKLENLLIDPITGKITVIDFGLCAILEEIKTESSFNGSGILTKDGKLLPLCKEWCGSDNYIAPEVVRKIAYDGFKADTFSTGVVLFCLLFGVFPFDSLRVHGSRSLKKLSVRFPSDVNVSESAKDLVMKMLEDDASKRLTIDECFAHEWILESGSNPSSVTSSPQTHFKTSCESVIAN